MAVHFASALLPEGWAKNAVANGPSRRPSTVVPASTRRSPVSGSKVHSWCEPAIATTTRPCHQARSHGVESVAEVSPTATRVRSWLPSPARVRTSPSDSRRPRRAWLTLSATTTS